MELLEAFCFYFSPRWAVRVAGYRANKPGQSKDDHGIKMQTERKRLGGFLPCLERGCLPCECSGAWTGSAKLSDLEATNVFSFNIQMYLRSTWCRSICWTSLCSQAIQCCSAIYLLQMHVRDFFIVAIIPAPGSCKYCSSRTQLKCRSPLRLMFEMLSFCLPSKVFL